MIKGDASDNPTAESEVATAGKTLKIIVNGQGNVTPLEGMHLFEEGTVVKLEAIPAEGWKFVEWVIGSEENSKSIITVDITGDMEIKAVFSPEAKPVQEPELLPKPEPAVIGETEEE